MKHTVNPQIFTSITLVMVAAVLSACSSRTPYYYNNSYVHTNCTGERPCPYMEQTYVKEVEIEQFSEDSGVSSQRKPMDSVVSLQRKSISQSTPGGVRAVPVKPKPCVKKDWVEKGWVNDIQPGEVKKKPKPPVEETTPMPKPKPQAEPPIPAPKPQVEQAALTPEPLVKQINEALSVANQATQSTREGIIIKTVIVETQLHPRADVQTQEQENKQPQSVKQQDELQTTAQSEQSDLEEEKARLESDMEKLKEEQERLAEEKEKVIQQIEESKKCDEIKDWVASEGSTLRGLLTKWGDEAGWRVVWNMDRDYTLEAGAIFRGRFMDVSAALLRSFARARPAPKGVFYKGNKVLVISTREDENAE